MRYNRRFKGRPGNKRDVELHCFDRRSVPIGNYLDVQKVVIGKGRVERGDQIEERLATDRVAERALLVAGDAPAVLRVSGGHTLRGRQSLQVAGMDALRIKAFVHRLVAPGHFTGIALDAAADLAVARLDAEGIVDGLERAALQQLHV